MHSCMARLKLNLHNYSYRHQHLGCPGLDSCELSPFARLARLLGLASCVLRELAGLHQFVDVVVCGEHCWIFEILEFFAFHERLLAVDAILAILGGAHVLEEAQDVWVIGGRLAQFI